MFALEEVCGEMAEGACDIPEFKGISPEWLNTGSQVREWQGVGDQGVRRGRNLRQAVVPSPVAHQSLLEGLFICSLALLVEDTITTTAMCLTDGLQAPVSMATPELATSSSGLAHSSSQCLSFSCSDLQGGFLLSIFM